MLESVVDYVLPLLAPYDFAIYVLMLRKAMGSENQVVRIGKRSIAKALGKGTRASSGNYQHISERLQALEAGGWLTSADTNREGTSYRVFLPEEVPAVAELMRVSCDPDTVPNWYREPDLRRELFERDSWTCRYCGGAVSPDTATLDHFVPVAKDGTSDPSNLVTACLICNSVKGSRTLDEAAPEILRRVAAERSRNQ